MDPATFALSTEGDGVESSIAQGRSAKHTAPERVEQLRQQAKELFQRDEETAEAIDAICEANGWSRDDFINKRHTYTYLELFLLQFPSMHYVKYFPNLVTVKLMNIALKEVDSDDFARLPNLERLWLSENDLTTIRGSGFRNCRRLKELFVHNNMLTQLEPFLHTPMLEVLYANRNRFMALDGMNTLPKLRHLSVASNAITTIRGTLEKNLALEELNLAANKISSFREIPCLNVLPNLTQLFFSDPLYGANPIAMMSNYQTFVLYCVHRVTYLDSIFISPEQRAVAEVTFAKKRVYYSMRLHTISRNLHRLCEVAESFVAKQLEDASSAIKRLNELRADISREENNYLTSAAMAGRTPPSGLTAALAVVEKAIISRQREVTELNRQRAHCEREMREAALSNGSRLLMELDTGANIRLEDGRLKDPWFQSCTELLKTRFFATDFAYFTPLGIDGISVSRVTRIHNRALRGAFDRELARLVDVTDPSYKRALEYLFFALPIQGCTEVSNERDVMDTIIEFGFRGMLTGDTGAIPMTNSVYLADQIRLMDVVSTGAYRTSDKALQGRIVVSKVFLGRSLLEKGITSVDPGPGTPFLRAYKPVDRRDYPKDVLSVHRSRPDDPKQRLWHCFDSSLVLPEYIIDFTYSTTIMSIPRPPLAEWPQTRNDELAAALKELVPEASNGDMVDFKHLAPHLMSLQRWISQSTYTALAKRDTQDAMNAAQSLRLKPPTPTAGGELSAALLASVTDKNVDKKLHPKLCLSACALSSVSLGPGAVCDVVNCLDLSDNALVLNDAEWLMLSLNFPSLEKLILNSNRIEGLPNNFHASNDGKLPLFPKLKGLFLSSNQIRRVDRLLSLKDIAPSLTELDVFLNPFQEIRTDEESFGFIAVCCCPRTLATLNGLPVESMPRLKELRAAPMSLAPRLASKIQISVADRLYNGPHFLTLAGTQEDTSASDITSPSKGEPFMRRSSDALGIIGRALLDTSINIPARAALSVSSGMLDVLSMESVFAASFAVVQKGRFPYQCWDKGGSRYIDPPESHADSDASSVLGLCEFLSLNTGFLTKLPVTTLALTNKLVHLQLRNQFITEIDADIFSSLPNLETCDLRHNLISDIPLDIIPLLPKLRRLDLGFNQIKDITPLCAETGFPFLNYLAIDHNKVTSLGRLAAMEGLQELYLSHNDISDEKETITALRELPQLIILDLAQNPCVRRDLYRLYVIFYLKKLKVLDGSSIDVEEATQARDTFAGRVSSELLNERIAPETNWAAVVNLNLSNCALKEVLLLESFTALLHLSVDHNNLLHLDGLACCTGLLTLNAGFNHLRDTPIGVPLASMTRLESLSLESNGIASLAALQLDLPKLKFLNLTDNELKQLDGTARLAGLRELVLSRNRIKTLDREHLLGIPTLRTLYCDDNQLKSLENLTVLRYLTTATFVANRLGDVQDVFRSLSGMAITTLSLLGNAVIRKPTYRTGIIHLMPELRMLDGREVTAEEREKVEIAFEAVPPGVVLDVRMPMGGGPITVASSGRNVPSLAAGGPGAAVISGTHAPRVGAASGEMVVIGGNVTSSVAQVAGMAMRGRMNRMGSARGAGALGRKK